MSPARPTQCDAPSYEARPSDDSISHVSGFAWNCVEHINTVIRDILELCSGNSVWICLWVGGEEPCSEAVAEKGKNREDKVNEGETSHKCSAPSRKHGRAGAQAPSSEPYLSLSAGCTCSWIAHARGLVIA